MKSKILILSIALLLLNNPAFSVDKPNEKQASKSDKSAPVSQEKDNSRSKDQSAKINGSVSDYRTEVVNIDWWGKFSDPVLSGYISKALQANHDIKIAGLRVSEYQQIVNIAFGQEFPALSIGSNSTVQGYSKNYIPLFSGTIQNYTFPLSASYELDIWRKNRDKTLSQKKQLEAIAYDEKAALISIVSEVASVYLNILTTNSDISFQKQIVELKSEKLKLIQARLDAGVTTYDDVIAGEKALTDAKVALNDYEKNLGILKTALAVLTGDSPDNIAEMKFGNINNIDSFSNLTDKVKSDKILKRPDILKAEAQLQKAKIDVTIARKEYLPDITLTGQAGFNSKTFSKVFDSNSFTYGFGGNILESVFSGGQKKAMLKSKKYLYDQMLENYQNSIIVSLKEVNDALLKVKTSKQKNEDYLKKLNLEKDNIKLTDARYEAGAISYLETLDPKEKLISIQKDQLQSKTEYIINNFSLYKALGANF